MAFSEFDVIDTNGDLVHHLIAYEPKCSPPGVMQIIKSITARKIFNEYSLIKKKLLCFELLSGGGSIGTVGEDITCSIIKTCIKNKGN
jgi:REP element-mobilizing transposase RayT